MSEEPSQLERLLAPVTRVPVVEATWPGDDVGAASGALRYLVGEGDPVWVRGSDLRVYVRHSGATRHGAADEVAQFSLPDGTVIRADWDEQTSTVTFPFSLSEAYDNLIAETWREATRASRLSPGQLDVFYRVKPLIPRRLQLAARRLLVRRQRAPEFPAWPFDDSIAQLVRLYSYCVLLVLGQRELPFRWFWPDGHAASLMLTHDVETQSGLRLAVELADLEQELGFRSSFNVGQWYDIDQGIIRELTDRGFEIGLHGIRHDRSLFRSRADFDSQRDALARAADALGAEGFRSPSTFRVFDWLGELPVSYDASLPHSDPFEPQPGGCCSLWPFFIGPVVELPYTLPQDHTLFTLLQARSIDLWLEQADLIERRNGLIHCVSHPDRGYLGDKDKRALYAEFLRAMAERHSLWRALPRDVARWWRLRDESSEMQAPITVGVVRRGEASGDIDFVQASDHRTHPDSTPEARRTARREPSGSWNPHALEI